MNERKMMSLRQGATLITVLCLQILILNAQLVEHPADSRYAEKIFRQLLIIC